MTATDRPDDRADVIEAAAKVLNHTIVGIARLGMITIDAPEGIGFETALAHALNTAGLLVTPADQDALRLVNEGWPIVNPSRYAELKRAEAERDHAQERAELAEKDIRSAHFDAARALAERDLLRAQVAAVEKLADQWERMLDATWPATWTDELRSCHRDLIRALDTAGGEQHGK